jgi:hypothetical protein
LLEGDVYDTSKGRVGVGVEEESIDEKDGKMEVNSYIK